MFTLYGSTLLCLTFTIYLASYGGCVNKTDLETQAHLFKDIAYNLKYASKALPTTSQVIENIQRKDEEELKRIDEDIKKEIREEKQKHGSCEVVSYERDYSFECPAGWSLCEDGTCWGQDYAGPCKSKQSFKWFDEGQKRRIESECCAFWPKKVNGSTKSGNRLNISGYSLHGVVNHTDGRIIPPRDATKT